MANIYERRRLWKIAFLAVSLVLVAVFLQVSNNLVKDLSQQERDRMEIWAKATKELATAPVYDPMPLDSLGTNYMAMPSSDIDFFLGIIEDNRKTRFRKISVFLRTDTAQFYIQQFPVHCLLPKFSAKKAEISATRKKSGR